MFKKLRVRNFRSIRDSGDIELSNLNIFVGPNNSGKSSLLYALLLLKQTITDKDPQNVLVISGPHVDLGSYIDIIRGHDSKKELGIEFELDEKVLPKRQIYNVLDGALKTVEPLKDYKIKFRFDPKINAIGVHSFIIGNNTVNLKYTGELRGSEWILSGIPKQAKKYVSLQFEHFLPHFRPQDKPPPTANAQKTTMDVYISTRTQVFMLEEIVNEILYVGPLRERIPRYGILGTMPYSELGPSGQNLMRVLSRIDEPGRYEASVLQQLDYWLNKKFKLFKNVRIDNIDEGGTVKALIADEAWGNNNINLSAMGTGISQLVPVVVQTVLTPRNGCLIVEQPEIHLHPAAQANLADLFINYAKKKRQLIVETHSEHLLLRVRRRIAEGRIATDNVRIFSVEKKGTQTIIESLPLKENGHFERWPDGFFEEGYMEAMAIAEAQSK